MRVHYNHCRRHDSIKKTSAEAAGIHTEGASKWKAIIQNSSLHLIATDSVSDSVCLDTFIIGRVGKSTRAQR